MLLSLLPKEVLMQILQYLSLSELLATGRASKDLLQHADHVFWPHQIPTLFSGRLARYFLLEHTVLGSVDACFRQYVQDTFGCYALLSDLILRLEEMKSKKSENTLWQEQLVFLKNWNSTKFSLQLNAVFDLAKDLMNANRYDGAKSEFVNNNTDRKPTVFLLGCQRLEELIALLVYYFPISKIDEKKYFYVFKTPERFMLLTRRALMALDALFPKVIFSLLDKRTVSKDVDQLLNKLTSTDVMSYLKCNILLLETHILRLPPCWLEKLSPENKYDLVAKVREVFPNKADAFAKILGIQQEVQTCQKSLQYK